MFNVGDVVVNTYHDIDEDSGNNFTYVFGIKTNKNYVVEEVSNDKKYIKLKGILTNNTSRNLGIEPWFDARCFVLKERYKKKIKQFGIVKFINKINKKGGEDV